VWVAKSKYPNFAVTEVGDDEVTDPAWRELFRMMDLPLRSPFGFVCDFDHEVRALVVGSVDAQGEGKTGLADLLRAAAHQLAVRRAQRAEPDAVPNERDIQRAIIAVGLSYSGGGLDLEAGDGQENDGPTPAGDPAPAPATQPHHPPLPAGDDPGVPAGAGGPQATE
jgi:hypothetical protein